MDPQEAQQHIRAVGKFPARRGNGKVSRGNLVPIDSRMVTVEKSGEIRWFRALVVTAPFPTYPSLQG